jgi:hypothetical protein
MKSDNTGNKIGIKHTDGGIEGVVGCVNDDSPLYGRLAGELSKGELDMNEQVILTQRMKIS